MVVYTFSRCLHSPRRIQSFLEHLPREFLSDREDSFHHLSHMQGICEPRGYVTMDDPFHSRARAADSTSSVNGTVHALKHMAGMLTLLQ